MVARRSSHDKPDVGGGSRERLAPAGVVRFAMSRVEAAFMAGVSTGTFDKMVADGALPQPRSWGARKLWLKPELELALLDLPEAPDATPNPWDSML